MIKARNVHLVLALAAVAALPGCSDMFGNRGSGARSAAAAAPQPVANDMVRQVQDKLKNDGYYKTGAVDGVWGAGTMTAVQNFQRDHSLTPSGQLDVPTLQALNVANTGPAPNTTTPANPNAPAGPANSYPDNRTYNGQPANPPATGTNAPR